MHIRIHQTGNLDLDTVAKMLCLADSQANIHPESRWILCEKEDIIFAKF